MTSVRQMCECFFAFVCVLAYLLGCTPVMDSTTLRVSACDFSAAANIVAFLQLRFAFALTIFLKCLALAAYGGSLPVPFWG